MSNKKLNAVITIGGAISSTFKSVVGTTTSQLHKIGSEVSKLKSSQRQLGDSIQTFGRMGKNVDNLRGRYSAVTAELKKLESQQIRLNKIEKERLSNNEKLANLKGQIGSAVATVVSMGAPVKMAIDFETAMLGVAKQLDGARDKAGNLTKDFFNMQTEILRVADNSPVARNEIAEMVSAGLRMGVAKNEVVSFTQEVIKMGTAFELPMGQLADDMGKIGNMYKIPITQIGKLADTINYLDDNSLSKGGDIIDFMQRVGGTASMVKITEKNTAALGSTLLSLGEKSETASTAVNAVFSKLGAANTGSKSFREMVTEIGLSTVELEKGMQTNATDTIFKVMDAIRKLPKEASMEKVWVPPKMSKDGKKQLKGGYYAETPATTQIDAVSTLFGAEHWDTFSKLLENRGELQKQITMANSKDAQGSMDKEYQARMKTTQAQIDEFKNRIGRLGVEFGSVLLPVVNDVLGSVGKFATKISEWSQKNPQLTSAIAKTVVVLGTFKVGLLAAQFAIFAVNSPLLKIKDIFATTGLGAQAFTKTIGLMISPIKMIGTVFGVVGKAMLANPMVLAIVAIVAVVAGAAYLIYKNWEPIKKFFSDLWEGVKTNIGSAWDGIKSSLSKAWDGVKGVFDKGINFIKGVIESVDTVFANNPILNILLPFIGIPRMIIANWSDIKGFFSSLWQSISSKASDAWKVITNVFSQVGGWFSQKWEQVKSITKSVWTSVTSSASEAWNSITGFFSPIGDWFAAKWEHVKLVTFVIWSGIKKVVTAVWDNLISAITNSPLFQSVVNGWTTIFDYLGTLKDKMLNIGKNIIDGLVNGIKSGFDSLKSVWTSINNYMPDFMRKKMDIHSPSRVMAGLGGHIVDGIGVGMQERRPALKQEFRRVLETFTTNQKVQIPKVSLTSDFFSKNSEKSIFTKKTVYQDPVSPAAIQAYLPNKEQTKTVKKATPQQSQAPSITQHFSFSISAAPNQSPQQIADEVIRKFKQQQGVEQRNSMVDWGYSQ